MMFLDNGSICNLSEPKRRKVSIQPDESSLEMQLAELLTPVHIVSKKLQEANLSLGEALCNMLELWIRLKSQFILQISTSGNISCILL